MTIWAAHPKPKEDELLSSWLIRISSECGMSAVNFCAEVLNVENPNLRIVDRSPDDLLLQGLAEGTGVPVERVREASLLAEEGYVFSQSGKGVSRWIIPAFTVHTKRRGNIGMAYCPECLRADAIPYYRKNWHYAYYAICATHRIPLRNYCPHCECPYSHMQPGDQSRIYLLDPIRSCWSCGGNVGIAPPSSPWGGDLLDMTLSIQENILAGISRGAFDAPGHGHVFSRAYLDAFYSIVRSLTSLIDSSTRMKHVGRVSGIEFVPHLAKPLWIYKGIDIEDWRAEDRAILLCLANWLMGDWPTRLVAYAGKAKLKYSVLFDCIDSSHWMTAFPVHIGIRQVAGTHTDEERANATRMLRQMAGRAVSTYEVQEFMTKGTLYHKIKKQISAKKSAREWQQRFLRDWEKDLQAAKRKRLAKIITWSQSKKFMAKNERAQERGNDGIELNAAEKDVRPKSGDC